MGSKEQVLELLLKNRGYISGEKMAEQLHISRNSVWKAIQSLRKAGYQIDAATNRGYALVDEDDIHAASQRRVSVGASDEAGNLKHLYKEEIFRYLNPYLDRRLIHVYEKVDSTNKLAKEMAIAGAPHGTALIAGKQTGGQAHHLQSFYSPEGGIYLSLILNPEKFRRTDPKFFSETSAVAVMGAIRKVCGIQTEIRGKNDLYDRKKKVCGILNETVMDLENSDLQWIVSGIGIHFAERESEFPENIRDVTGSLYPDGQAKASINYLAAEVVNQFVMEKFGDVEEVRKAYRMFHRD